MYKEANKYYIGSLFDDSTIAQFDPIKMQDAEGFKEGQLHFVVVGKAEDGIPEVAEVDVIRYQPSAIEDDEDMIVLANRVLQQYKSKLTYH